LFDRYLIAGLFVKESVLATKGAFSPSHFSNKLDDKLAHKVALQTNVTHFCLVCQSEVCCKPNWFATNSLRQLCKQVCHQVCCTNVMVETHLNSFLAFVHVVLPGVYDASEPVAGDGHDCKGGHEDGDGLHGDDATAQPQGVCAERPLFVKRLPQGDG
jgi:hypothetical protein